MNKSSALCYVPFLGMVVALVVLVVEEDKKLRFVAAQSLLTHVFYWGVMFLVIPMMTMTVFLAPLAWLIRGVVGVMFFVGWLALAIKEYEGETVRLPYVDVWAEKIAKR